MDRKLLKNIEYPILIAIILITIKPRDMILSDIFNILSLKPKGVTGRLFMKKNGIDAGFADPLKNNDKIDIYWENIPN